MFFSIHVTLLSSIPGHIIPKTLKMVLDTSLLNTQQYKVHIESKVEQSRERSYALSLLLCVVAIDKGAFWLPSTMVTNFTLLILPGHQNLMTDLYSILVLSIWFAAILNFYEIKIIFPLNNAEFTSTEKIMEKGCIFFFFQNNSPYLLNDPGVKKKKNNNNTVNIEQKPCFCIDCHSLISVSLFSYKAGSWGVPLWRPDWSQSYAPEWEILHPSTRSCWDLLLYVEVYKE